MAGGDGGRCERWGTDLSGFVDQTLPPRRWERVGYHVAGCEQCRADVADLQRVRSTLRAAAPQSDGVPQLSERLQGIAGETCDQPLYMASGPVAALPTRRLGRRRRMRQGGLAVVAAVTSFFVLAILLAPDPPQISNPVGLAREQFSLSVTAISVNEAVGAVLLAHGRGAVAGPVVSLSPRASIVSAPFAISAESAAEMLSLGSSSGLTYSGIQRVWISDGEGSFHASDVRIDEVAGRGASLVVLDSLGNRYLSWFVPSSPCCDAAAPQDWSFVEYRGMDQVAGRWAKVIEALDGSGRKVARWWVDTANGLLLWSERYDTTGQPTLVSGFTELRPGEASLEVDRTEVVIMDTVTAGGGRDWCVGLPSCPEELGGLPLVAHASSDVGGRDTMRLVYSDGFRSLSVCWSEGVLKSEAGERVDDMAPGQPLVSVWQVGGRVVSVATNGDPALLQAVREELPAEAPYEPTLWDRLGRGLTRLTGIQ